MDALRLLSSQRNAYLDPTPCPKPSDTLDTDKFLRAIMQLRNAPDPDGSISPAIIVFGRPTRDAFAFVNRLEKFSSKHVRPVWKEAWQKKEEALY